MYHCSKVLIIYLLIFLTQKCLGRPQQEESEAGYESNVTTSSQSEYSLLLNRTSSTSTEIVHICGRSNAAGLNKNSLEFLSSSLSKDGQYPWVVAIMRKLTNTSDSQNLLYSGAGSLIHPLVVLTAFDELYTPENIIVRAGEWDFNEEEEEHPSQDRSVARARVLDVFDMRTIQLLFMSEPFLLSPNVHTVCITAPTTSIYDRNDCVMAGWGQKSCSDTKGLHSIQGHTDLTTGFDKTLCTNEWQQYLEDKKFGVKDYEFCTVRKNIREQSCFCDHGAALFCKIVSSNDEPRFEQIGVAVASKGCKRDLPGIYANVALYRNSIDQLFEQELLDKSFYIMQNDKNPDRIFQSEEFHEK